MPSFLRVTWYGNSITLTRGQRFFLFLLLPPPLNQQVQNWNGCMVLEKFSSMFSFHCLLVLFALMYYSGYFYLNLALLNFLRKSQKLVCSLNIALSKATCYTYLELEKKIKIIISSTLPFPLLQLSKHKLKYSSIMTIFGLLVIWLLDLWYWQLVSIFW